MSPARYTRYKLRKPTVGVVNASGKRVVITMPADALLEVSGEKAADGTVDVVWDDQRISMFAIDLEQRGDLV